MISKAQALALAKKIPMPTVGTVVTIPSVEVMCAFMELHGLKAAGWRGHMLVLAPKSTPENDVPGEEGAA